MNWSEWIKKKQNVNPIAVSTRNGLNSVQPIKCERKSLDKAGKLDHKLE